MIKILLIFCTLATSALMNAQEAEDSSKAQAQKYIVLMNKFQAEASLLPAQKIFDEIERIRTILKLRMELGKSMFELGLTEDGAKGSGYALALEDKKEKFDVDGSYYWGLYNLKICGGLSSIPDTNGTQKTYVDQCLLKSLKSFSVASDGGDAASSHSIGSMYENGYGVDSSKLIAADWFLKAARQALKNENRALTLRAIESTLRVFPNNPEALRLKDNLFK